MSENLPTSETPTRLCKVTLSMCSYNNGVLKPEFYVVRYDVLSETKTNFVINDQTMGRKTSRVDRSAYMKVTSKSHCWPNQFSECVWCHPDQIETAKQMLIDHMKTVYQRWLEQVTEMTATLNRGVIETAFDRVAADDF